ncbi:hypothetical protein AS156_23385 [Bradyrhizobium macuxiense]|uniref:Uncharacterized protein n=1 Tax=Bradyrhizobium macuxiense TaxID=1755647 RepID=A0A109JB49_9BRAD|nr:hypothetical protein [Bradyrhizobium macuxiense]KWV45705.1 hypothetical protein AS156_23385 [Bradyrhizobium macuxiense]
MTDDPRPDPKQFPCFAPEMTKGGRWFVAVKTGKGPDSHIGDFATEAEAKDWISTKSKYWPGKPDQQMTIRAKATK